MVKVLFDEANILSLEAAARTLAEERKWKSYTVDAQEGKINAVARDGTKFYIDLNGFAYDEDGEETIDRFEVDWRLDLFGDTWKSVLFAKNEDGEYVIIHD